MPLDTRKEGCVLKEGNRVSDAEKSEPWSRNGNRAPAGPPVWSKGKHSDHSTQRVHSQAYLCPDHQMRGLRYVWTNVRSSSSTDK